MHLDRQFQRQALIVAIEDVDVDAETIHPAPTASLGGWGPITTIQAAKKDDPDSLVFEGEDVLKRIERDGDLFEPVLKLKQNCCSFEHLFFCDPDFRWSCRVGRVPESFFCYAGAYCGHFDFARHSGGRGATEHRDRPFAGEFALKSETAIKIGLRSAHATGFDRESAVAYSRVRCDFDGVWSVFTRKQASKARHNGLTLSGKQGEGRAFHRKAGSSTRGCRYRESRRSARNVVEAI